MKCGPAYGCQSSKTSGESRPELISVSWQDSKEGTTSGGFRKGAHPVAVDLPSRVSAPECKTSAEKKRASWAVRPKGNLLEGNERMPGL